MASYIATSRLFDDTKRTPSQLEMVGMPKLPKPEFKISKSLRRAGAKGNRPTVHVEAFVAPRLRELLMDHFAHETLLQKPILFGSLPTQMHRDSSGLPINTHLINFLQGGDTVVITVGSLLAGYSFQASSIWDAIAFEQFAKNAFIRFETICDHAEAYAKGIFD